MHTAVRPYATAGVALVGASVIAVAPMAAPLPDVHIPSLHASAPVELAAFVNPITEWVNVITTTVANLGGLGQEIAANPAPILTQIIANQIGYVGDLTKAAQDLVTALQTQLSQLPATLQTAFGQLAAGNIFGAVDTVWSYALTTLIVGVGLPVLEGVVPIVQGVVGNLNNVVQNGTLALLLLALAPIYPVNATVYAGAATAQDFVTALSTGDVVTALSDIINTPAILTGAFLNGFPASSSFLDPAGGLLTNPTAGGPGFGTIENILFARTTIGGLLAPPMMAANVLPNPAANTVTVTTAPAVTALAPAVTTSTTTPPNVKSGLTTATANGNKAAPGMLGGGTASGGLATAVKATGNEVSSTLSKIGAGTTGGSGHVPKHAK